MTNFAFNVWIYIKFINNGIIIYIYMSINVYEELWNSLKWYFECFAFQNEDTPSRFGVTELIMWLLYHRIKNNKIPLIVLE